MATTSRHTAQREVLDHALRSTAHPLSAQELWTEAQRQNPRLGLATVYRFLAKLEKDGRLKRLEIIDEPPRFELNDGSHHHHFFCRSCHTVYSLPGCVKGLRNIAPRNFQVEDHDIVLYGQCEECTGLPPKSVQTKSRSSKQER